MLLKIQKSDIKIPDFRQNFQNKKTILKMFLCIRPSVSKLKNHGVFLLKKKQCFNMHFGFNNQFIKVKRTLAKISKTTKILFFFIFFIFLCLSFSIRGMNLHVKLILDIKTIVLL